jgi:hypothetical protein
MINFNPKKMIRQLLPTFSRKPIRLAWLDTLLLPFSRRWSKYTDWRIDKNYEAHVTCQTASMEAYLNRLFDAAQRRITITDAYFNENVYVALREENYDDLYIDGDEGKIIYLEEETIGNGFVVNLPEDLADFALEIRGAVEKIRALGIGYTIMIGDMPYVTLSAPSIWLPPAGGGATTEINSNTEWYVI